MRLLFALILLAAPLFAAHPDTLWVARNKADRSVVIALAPGWSIEYGGRGRATVTGQAVTRDSTGAVVTLESKRRLIGADTSRVELVATAADTLPSEWPGDYILTEEGYFERE